VFPRIRGHARDAARSTLRTVVKTRAKQLVVCIDNEGYESGEDYLYPKKSFRPIALPLAVKRAVLAA
jgi:hypothetical protein